MVKRGFTLVKKAFIKRKKSGSKRSKRKKAKRKPAILYPKRLVKPIGVFLQQRLKKLEWRRKVVAEEDPFANTSRISDNASPDTDAAEQFGHARTSAIKEQLEKKIIQTKKAMSRVRVGKYGVCEECGKMIDTDRLMIYPEATLCATDAAKKEE